MALVKGENSYASVEEADAYFADRIDKSAWADADDTEKEQALMTATSMLDDQHWSGKVVSLSQVLAFPRIGTYFDPRLGYIVEYPDTGVPTRVLTSLYELAYHLLTNEEILESTSNVSNITVGSIKLESISNVSRFPSRIKSSIKPLLQNPGNTWWRAN